MTFVRSLSAISGSLVLSACAIAPSLPAYAPGAVRDTYFGTEVADPYRGLEDMADAKVTAWMRAHADHARRTLDSPPKAELALALGRAQLATNDVPGAERSLRWANDFWQRYDPRNRAGGVAAAHLARVLEVQSNAPAAGELRRRAQALLKSDPRPGDQALLL